MNDVELKKTLSALTPPVAAEEERSRALYQATIALSQPGSPADPSQAPSRARIFRLVLVNSLALAALVVGCFMAVNQRASSSASSATIASADLRTLAQVQELFPGQLDAVIEREGRLQISLASDSSLTGQGQPLVIQFENAGHALRVLSYSGRSVTIELNGSRITFDALITNEGGIVLSGADFAWDSDSPKLIAGYRVKARPLGAAL